MLGGAVWLRLGGEQTARAQFGRGQPNVSVVSGFSGGQAIVYVLESNTGQLIAVRTDPVNRKVDLVTRRNVAQDMR
jgi:hypothetical protein